MAIKNRVKEIRKALNITQPDFSKRMSISSGYLAQLETGAREFNDRMIKLICDEFNVNEIWLRSGEGTMFKEANLELAELLGENINNLSDFQINIIKEFIKLPPEHLEIIRQFIKRINI